MGAFLTAEGLVALATLTFLEVVLGVDNVIFISILSGKLPPDRQHSARRTGLLAAMAMRIGLLMSIVWIIRLTEPIVTIGGRGISGRDLVLIAGGVFLLGKATVEIHDGLEGDEGHTADRLAPSFAAVILQIMVLDIVFSLDSVITAVGMANQVAIMIAAIVLAMGFMMFAAGPVSMFVERHPTVKMLALSFLLLIGVTLIAEGLGQHISKGYVYFAMAFSVFVELLNLRARKGGARKLPGRPGVP
jgi:predicted tellurium resistance membrane protein TerC